MKSFKVFLFEMSILDARKVMGFTSKFTAKELKARFRRMSMKNHPDRGGDVEIQKSINVAYELLKTDGGSSVGASKGYNSKDTVFTKEWQAAHDKKYNETAVIVRDDLVKNFDTKTYTDYFSKIFNEPFKVTNEKMYPSDAEIDRVSNLRYSSSVNHVSYNVEFSNKNNTRVFNLNLYVNITDLMGKSRGLGGSNTTYPMGVSTYAYIDSRKVKITARDYTNTTKKNVFSKPSVVFPKSKIVNKKKGKFKKSHMLAALKSEIQAKNSGDWWYVPLGDGNSLGIWRMTLMDNKRRSTAFWNTGGIFKRNERNTRFIEAKEFKMRHHGYVETEEFLNILRTIKTYSTKDAIKYLNSEYDRLLNADKNK